MSCFELTKAFYKQVERYTNIHKEKYSNDREWDDLSDEEKEKVNKIALWSLVVIIVIIVLHFAFTIWALVLVWNNYEMLEWDVVVPIILTFVMLFLPVVPILIPVCIIITIYIMKKKELDDSSIVPKFRFYSFV